jgi:hypothetical protein
MELIVKKFSFLAYLGLFLATFNCNIRAISTQITAQTQAQIQPQLLHATDDALCPLGADHINIDSAATQLIFGMTQANFLGPNAFKNNKQVCFSAPRALEILQKHKLVAPETTLDQLISAKILKFAGTANTVSDLQKFVLGCELLKNFDQGILANTSTDLREANCKYLRNIAPACGEFFGDLQFTQGPGNYRDLLVCSVGGSSVTPENPLASGTGLMCAHSDGLCATHETNVNLKDSPYILGIDFMNTPFTNKTFDPINQVCFDLGVAKSIMQKYKIIEPETAINQLTQNSPELQKFIFSCEFLKRNPMVVEPRDLVVRDTLCDYEKFIAGACAELYCNPEFKTVADSITCRKRGIGQINPRGRPYPAFQPVGLAAQVVGVQPEWHAAAPTI